MRSSFETAMMLLVTGVTNLCMLPAIVNLHRQEYVFEVRALLSAGGRRPLITLSRMSN